jgi:hypothetical protein
MNFLFFDDNDTISLFFVVLLKFFCSFGISIKIWRNEFINFFLDLNFSEQFDLIYIKMCAFGFLFFFFGNIFFSFSFFAITCFFVWFMRKMRSKKKNSFLFLTRNKYIYAGGWIILKNVKEKNISHLFDFFLSLNSELFI